VREHAILTRVVQCRHAHSQTASEGRNVTDVLSIFLQNDLGWGFTAINSFVTVYGFALVLAGLNVKRMINMFGLRGFTTVSNMVNFTSMMLYSIGTDWSMALGGVFLAPGSRCVAIYASHSLGCPPWAL
jgi:hypothetical protein